MAHKALKNRTVVNSQQLNEAKPSCPFKRPGAIRKKQLHSSELNELQRRTRSRQVEVRVRLFTGDNGAKLKVNSKTLHGLSDFFFSFIFASRFCLSNFSQPLSNPPRRLLAFFVGLLCKHFAFERKTISIVSGWAKRNILQLLIKFALFMLYAKLIKRPDVDYVTAKCEFGAKSFCLSTREDMFGHLCCIPTIE